MPFMAIVKSSPEAEAGALPDRELIAKMTTYNEELAKNGIMLAGEGLLPSSKGVRIAYSGDKRSVTDGPFAEAKELVAGFWLLQARSLDEAVEWLKRAPFEDGEVEIRQLAEGEDFGDEFTPELREREDRLREELSRKQP